MIRIEFEQEMGYRDFVSSRVELAKTNINRSKMFRKFEPIWVFSSETDIIYIFGLFSLILLWAFLSLTFVWAGFEMKA